MARRLVDAGHHVKVWNRTPEKMQPLVSLGVTPSSTPADASVDADAVMTMVADPAALIAVTEGPTGVVAGLRDGSTVIEMSTVGPGAVSRLGALFEGNLLDAPVLGSLTEAENGGLEIFVGGPAALYERWVPVLSELGSARHVGPLGTGAAAKLVANSTLLGTLTLLGEALALADGLGLSRAAALDVIAATPLGAQAERRRASVENDDYPLRFSLSLARKDAELVEEAAASCALDLRLAAAASSWFEDAERAGKGALDYSTVLTHIFGSR